MSATHSAAPRQKDAAGTMTVAVIGVGRMGSLHARLLGEQDAVRELLVADAMPGRAEEAAKGLGATAVSDVDVAIKRADAVVIVANTAAHAELVRMGITRGIPVFCEKPLAATLEETNEIVRLVDSSGIALQVGFQRRFDPAYRAARELVESGGLGKIYQVRMVALDHEPPAEAYVPTSGGYFRDSSIHDFDAIRWITGSEVDEVYAMGEVRGFEFFARHGDVDTAVATLRMTDGTLGVVAGGRHNPRGYDIRMEVLGSRDNVVMGLGPRAPLRSLERGAAPPQGPEWPSFLERFEEAYRNELLEFLRVARGEVASPCTARDGLEAMRVSVAATVSLQEHRPVRLAEIA
jgi:myo-inositol 2-dehydrogenase / D-chiro-inositol 1-dehydrogenase